MIERIVAGWPTHFDASRARALGFEAENDFGQIIRAYLEDENVVAVRERPARRSPAGRPAPASWSPAARRSLGLAGRLLVLTIGSVLLVLALFYTTRLSRRARTGCAIGSSRRGPRRWFSARQDGELPKDLTAKFSTPSARR